MGGGWGFIVVLTLWRTQRVVSWDEAGAGVEGFAG